MGTKRMGIGLVLLALAFDAGAQAAGDRILAVWPADGLWYPARVERVAGADVHIAYDDGDVGVVRAGQFGPVHWRRGTAVQCNWKNRGKYYGGVVASRDGERIEVAYDDGTRETITISRCRSLPPLER